MKLCEETDAENVGVRRIGWYGPGAAVGEYEGRAK